MATKINENDELRAQIAELKKQMESFQTVNAASVTGESTVTIGCRIMGGVVLENKDESIILRIPWKEEVEVYESDFRAVMANPFGYRELFKSDVIYFVNESDYAKFRISKAQSLSEETIKEEIMKPNMFNWLKEITSEKRRTNVLYCILFGAVSLYRAGELASWKYELRKQFQDYLGVDLDEYSNLLQEIKA